ncbi:hypothetical protein [Novosphingobium mangrovi (ex Huang et al. 2023)]|uniref:Uncharacterized protein n=1 Tax=Novosphingobium mangrovi (ex Huang et al. 2023) TaxID=2976432 RepID=A0ABT2I927_9SPHN|nr:hypothetical protein [Novosphingobium mangrovi (ex Huang et al. 2023)]MCT2401342.1 hypothetical protein [Novosphingobium mangrovi (ex Huang et al. 2023)]
MTRKIAELSENAILDLVAASTGRAREEVSTEYSLCLSEARKQLIAERGDPTPYRLG